jgi:hypothetical protein
MDKDQTLFTKDILRRVKRAYFYRTYLRPIALEISILAALIGVSAFFISLRNVFVNAYSAHSLPAFMRFAVVAFQNTSLSVKALSVGSLFIGLIVVRDFSSGLRHMTKGLRSAL